MKYFKLKNAVASEETGSEYPQAGMKRDYNFKAYDSIWNVSSDRFPDFQPNLVHLDTHTGANLTDFISSPVSHGFIVSKRVIDILKGFNLVSHRFYPAIIKHQNDFFNDYYWFHCVSNVIDYIDFTRSSFYIENFNRNEKELKVDSTKELVAAIRHNILQNRFIRATQLTLMPEFYTLKYDLFIISEALKDKLLEKQITGIEIEYSKQVSL